LFRKNEVELARVKKWDGWSIGQQGYKHRSKKKKLHDGGRGILEFKNMIVECIVGVGTGRT